MSDERLNIANQLLDAVLALQRETRDAFSAIDLKLEFLRTELRETSKILHDLRLNCGNCLDALATGRPDLALEFLTEEFRT